MLILMKSNGKPALHFASENGFFETAKLLIQSGADLNLKDE